MNDRRTALEIRSLEYSYKSDWTRRRFAALKGFSLDVYEGESFGFLGHNGAGKTTTIKCILGLVRPTGGTIKVFGHDHTETESRRSVGYLPEQPYFYDHLTVTEIMEMYAVLAGVPKGETGEAVRRALDRVRVSAKSKSPMRALSKGLTQRVALAQAIVGSPRLLVLDEPFSGLDPIGRKEFKDLFFELKKDGTTIFVSSHILGDVEFLCDRASIMAFGEIKEVFDMKDVPRLVGGSYELVVRTVDAVLPEISKLSDQVSTLGNVCRLSFKTKESAERALQIAMSGRTTVESYQFVQGNLEDLFVRLVKFDEAGK